MRTPWRRTLTTAVGVSALVGGLAVAGPAAPAAAACTTYPQYTVTADSLTVRGVPSFSGGTVDGANDHRIVMAAAVAATAAAAPVTITGAEAVRKSYPSFWEEYKRLGGSFDVL